MDELKRREILRYVKNELKDIVFINENSSIVELIHDLTRIIKEQEDGLISIYELYDQTVERNSDYITKSNILKEEIEKLKQENEILTELAGMRLSTIGSAFANISDPSQAILKLRSLNYQLSSDLPHVKNKYAKEMIESQIAIHKNTISDIQKYFEVK